MLILIKIQFDIDCALKNTSNRNKQSRNFRVYYEQLSQRNFSDCNLWRENFLHMF